MHLSKHFIIYGDIIYPFFKRDTTKALCKLNYSTKVLITNQYTQHKYDYYFVQVTAYMFLIIAYIDSISVILWGVKVLSPSLFYSTWFCY